MKSLGKKTVAIMVVVAVALLLVFFFDPVISVHQIRGNCSINGTESLSMWLFGVGYRPILHPFCTA